MRRIILVLAVLALALLPTGAALAGRTRTIDFDELPLGPLAPGQHIIGDFVVQRIGFGDTIEVVDLGNGHRGLADSDPTNGSNAGISILPRARRTMLRLRSLTAATDGEDGVAMIMGQWTEPYEYFHSEGTSPETFVPTFAGIDVAFLNAQISRAGAIVSVRVERSNALDPGYCTWTTSGKNRMKVRGFGKDRWTSEGTFETEGIGALFSAEEDDGTGEVLAWAGTWSRLTNRAFVLTFDAEGKAAFETLCARRFLEKTGTQGTFSLTSAVGKASYNRSRTRVRLKVEIRGMVTGSFGTKPFTLKARSKGLPAD